jgi:4a-hydroxytetrahydrobiopterin dehydratase
MTLADEHCVPVTRASTAVTASERAGLAAEIHDWRCVTRNGVERLERAFTFDDFAQALAFTNRVGAQADAEDHHPALLTEWGKVTVGWWTHVVDGLHRNDFVMAARTERIFSEMRRAVGSTPR